MMGVISEVMASQKLQVVSGTSKEGEWKECHAAHLPEMFRKFREIMVQELEARFHIKTTPDAPTLLALQMDPYVDTSGDDGFFSSRKAAQTLMVGEYKRALLARASTGSSFAGQAPAPAPPPPPPPPPPPRP